jgi:hypothetical protein
LVPFRGLAVTPGATLKEPTVPTHVTLEDALLFAFNDGACGKRLGSKSKPAKRTKRGAARDAAAKGLHAGKLRPRRCAPIALLF